MADGAIEGKASRKETEEVAKPEAGATGAATSETYSFAPEEAEPARKPEAPVAKLESPAALGERQLTGTEGKPAASKPAASEPE